MTFRDIMRQAHLLARRSEHRGAWKMPAKRSSWLDIDTLVDDLVNELPYPFRVSKIVMAEAPEIGAEMVDRIG